jgi:hypothetical protein
MGNCRVQNLKSRGATSSLIASSMANFPSFAADKSNLFEEKLFSSAHKIVHFIFNNISRTFFCLSSISTDQLGNSQPQKAVFG